jgi:hypothetical protein
MDMHGQRSMTCKAGRLVAYVMLASGGQLLVQLSGNAWQPARAELRWRRNIACSLSTFHDHIPCTHQQLSICSDATEAWRFSCTTDCTLATAPGCGGCPHTCVYCELFSLHTPAHSDFWPEHWIVHRQ